VPDCMFAAGLLAAMLLRGSAGVNVDQIYIWQSRDRSRD